MLRRVMSLGLVASACSLALGLPTVHLVTDSSLPSSLTTLRRILTDLDHDIREYDSKDPALRIEANESDSIVILAPSAKTLPTALNPQSLLAHVEAGRNVLIGLSSDLSEFWRDFGREFDLEFEERGSAAVDHFHYDIQSDADEHHTTLVLPLSRVPLPFVSESTRSGAPILYRGVGHERGRLPLATTILSGLPTTVSSDIGQASSDTTGADVLSGSSLSLISAVQAKNNARVTFVGSVDLFSDAFAEASIRGSDGSSFDTTGNVAFVKDLLKWTFQKAGVVRASNLKHGAVADGGASRALYRVRDELELSVDLSRLEDGTWRSFSPPDLQFEFVMMDPHLRLPLATSSLRSNSTTMGARFKAPDRHGVFTIRVDYRRPGWSFVDEKAVVSVTPPRHDEYERFIIGALPYYGGAFSVTAAMLVFVFAWTLQ